MATSNSIRPAPDSSPAGSSVDQFVTRILDRAGTQVKIVDLFTSLMLILTVVLGTLLIASLIDGWIVELSSSVRLAILIALAAFSLIVLVRTVAPLLGRRINPAYAARMIEQSEPRFKNSLLNYVFLRSVPHPNAQRVFEAVQAKAAQDLSAVSVESAIDRSKLIHVGFALVGVALAGGLYKLLSPKDPFDSVIRVIQPLADIPAPSRVRIHDVQPGSIDVLFGETVDVVADIRGIGTGNSVALMYSTDDGQQVGAVIPMSSGQAKNEFVGRLTTSDLGIQQSLTYWVVAGDGRSTGYRVNVQPSPTIAVSSIDLTPPAYTELPPLHLAGQSDIEGIEGTAVRLEAVANRTIANASVELLKAKPSPLEPVAAGRESTAAGRNAKTVSANDLVLIDRIPMKIDEQSATADFQLAWSGNEPKFTHYRLSFTAKDGQRNRFESVYSIRVKPDIAPEIEVLEPSQAKLQVPENGALTIRARALDPDFRIVAIRMVGLHKGSEKVRQNLELDQNSGMGHVTGRFVFRPESAGLTAGDQLIFHIAAIDNRCSPLSGQPEPNVTRSSNYELTVTPPVSSRDGNNRRDPANDRNKAQSEDRSEDSQSADPEEQSAGSQDRPDANQSGKQEGSEQGGGESGSGQSGDEMNKDDAQSSNGGAEGGNPDSSQQNQSDAGDDASSGDQRQSSNQPSNGGEGSSSEDSNAEQFKDSQPASAANQGAGREGDQGARANEKDSSERTSDPGEQNNSESNQDASRQDDGAPIDQNATGDGQSTDGDPRDSANPNRPDGSSNAKRADPESRENSGREQLKTDDQSKANDGPANDARPLDQASHDGERFEKLIERIEHPPNRSGNRSGNPAAGHDAGEQQAGGERQDESRAPADERTSDAAQGGREQEFADDSASTQRSDESNRPSESAGKQSDHGADSGKPNDQSTGQEAAQGDDAGSADSNDGADDSQAANEQPSESSTSKSNGQPKSDGSPDEPSNDSLTDAAKGDSNPRGDDSSSNDQSRNTASGLPADAPPESGTAQQQMSQHQFPDSATEALEGLDRKQPTPEEREQLEQTRQVTDLVLEYLKDQQLQPDSKLLDEMNWTEQELRDFVRRWEDLRTAASGGDHAAESKYIDALQSLGLRKQTERSRAARMQQDSISGLNEDGAISQPPGRFAEAFRDFSKGRARQASRERE